MSWLVLLKDNNYESCFICEIYKCNHCISTNCGTRENILSGQLTISFWLVNLECMKYNINVRQSHIEVINSNTKSILLNGTKE